MKAVRRKWFARFMLVVNVVRIFTLLTVCIITPVQSDCGSSSVELSVDDVTIQSATCSRDGDG